MRFLERDRQRPPPNTAFYYKMSASIEVFHFFGFPCVLPEAPIRLLSLLLFSSTTTDLISFAQTILWVLGFLECAFKLIMDVVEWYQASRSTKQEKVVKISK